MKSSNLFFLLVFLSISLNLNPNSSEKIQKFDDEVFKWLRTFAEVIEATKRNAYELPPVDQMMTKAIDAFMQYDRHGTLLNPTDFKNLSDMTSGEFCGIGIMLGIKNQNDDHIVILDVVQDGPASKVGVKPADKIVTINNKPLKKMNSDEIVKQLKGPKGTQVTIDVLRGESSEQNSGRQTFKITRDVIKEENSLCYYLKDLDIYYIHLALFTQQASHQIEQLLQKTQNKKIKGIIFDLRNNSGGLLHSAIDISGYILPKDSLVVYTKNRDNKIVESYKTTRDPILTQKIPMIFIVNEMTASAAEILVGTVKFYSQNEKNKNLSNVFVIGAQTCGKGSVQEIMPVSNECALKLTICHYFLADNNCVQGTGIKPDFIVEQKYPPTKDIKWMQDIIKNEMKSEAEKERAEKEKKEDEQKDFKTKRRDLISADYQIQTAANMISMLDLLNKCDSDKVATREKTLKTLKKNLAIGDTTEVEQV
ncbi:S41 family peptidase [Candidatus Dependentiae bacterium]|nr:S41 family peptidase [Candidatus Dependentiae bacterium]